MFTGEAEAALAHYQRALPALVVENVTRHPDGAMAGKILKAEARLAQLELLVFDSPPAHAFGFTPAISLFIDFTGPQDLEDAFSALSEGGKILMPLDAYGFSRRYGWVEDKFGVSWQLNLP
jgi:predicted 3-demethylubiquinone-9 3-methyltransferase (glyoxalase superfamily)